MAGEIAANIFAMQRTAVKEMERVASAIYNLNVSGKKAEAQELIQQMPDLQRSAQDMTSLAGLMRHMPYSLTDAFLRGFRGQLGQG